MRPRCQLPRKAGRSVTERAILGKPVAKRQAARQELSLPLVTDLGTCLRGQRAAWRATTRSQRRATIC